jgi:signal peptidase II
MSLSLGPSSRWWFSLLAIATLLILAYMYKQTSPDDRVQIASIALICGGAVGNLIDRLRSARGVVDFIDIGIGTHRFWTFNIADLGVTIGTATLTWIFCARASEEERRSHGIQPTGALDEPN